jgi:hypothetical protein
MLALSPAFVVEQNLMVDTPLLALWLAFFTPLVCGAGDERQNRRYALAGLACAAAVLTKYSSLVLLPILALSLILERRPRQSWAMLIPLAALGAWSVFNYLDYGGVHIAERLPPQPPEAWRPMKFLDAWILALGGLTPLGLIAMGQAWLAPRQARFAYLLAMGALATLALAVSSGIVAEVISDRLLKVIFAVNALAMVVALARGLILSRFLDGGRLALARSEAPRLYLLLWIGATTAFYVLFAPFIAARHVLLILPPVILLLVAGWRENLTMPAKVFGLAITAVISAGLIIDDWSFADFYRTEAGVLARMRPAAGRVWIDGHWGLQWYADRVGVPEIDVRATRPAAGDLLAFGAAREPLVRPPPLKSLRVDIERPPNLDVFCANHLYDVTYKQAVWSLGRRCHDARLEIFRVEPAS